MEWYGMDGIEWLKWLLVRLRKPCVYNTVAGYLGLEIEKKLKE